MREEIEKHTQLNIIHENKLNLISLNNHQKHQTLR